MFELVVAMCLEGGVCRDVLIPGHEAATEAACAAGPGAVAPAVPGLSAGRALCRPAGEALSLDEVASGLWVHAGAVAEPDAVNRGDISNLAVIVGRQSVAVVDTGSARWMGEALWRAIRARTDLPVSHVILTHMHPDHVLGATVFAEAGAELVGHAALPQALADRADTYLGNMAGLIGAAAIGTMVPQVTITVAEPMEIDLGDRILTVSPQETAHSGNDVTILDRKTGILLAGDLIFDRHVPALDGSLRGWQRVLGRLAAEPAAGVVPGHGQALMPWPEAAAPVMRYLDRLAADTRVALDDGLHMGEAITAIGAAERANWQLFDQYNARNATVAFAELEWE
mgnify:CR=1 FL=1